MFHNTVEINSSSHTEQDDHLIELDRDHQSIVSALSTGTRRRNVSMFQQNSPQSTATVDLRTNVPISSSGNMLDQYYASVIGAEIPSVSAAGGTPATPQPLLYGRHNELERLLQAYTRVAASSKAKSELVLIHGQGGAGKTCLVEALRGPISQSGGYFVTGKFEALSPSSGPYPALVEALTDLCDLIAQRKGFSRSCQMKMLQQIGPTDVRRLGKILGNIDRITGNTKMSSMIEDFDDDDMSVASTTTDTRQVLLQWSLQKFLRACASSKKHPICLFLDDLQMADRRSLRLLQALVSDTMSKHILFVAVYRSDRDSPEIREELLMKLNRVSVSEIQVLNLSMEAINDLIADSLQTDTASTLPLSEVVLRKTHGHIFCVLQYMEALRRDGFIRKSEQGGWMWDMVQIQRETDVTDNVVTLVTSKVQRCHKYVQLILKVACAIGYEFDRQLLEAVIVTECVASAGSSKKSIKEFERKIHKYLAIALRENLVEKTGYPGKYKFAHDRVKECVYDLIPKGSEREELHYRIGMCLQAMLSQHGEAAPEWMVFGAAEQLNNAGKLPSQPLELLRINLQAAKLAKIRGAFLPAVEFLRKAQALQETQTLFVEHYALARELHTVVAEVEYAVGDFERCEVAAKLVFKYSRRPEDKMRTFRTLIDALDALGRGNEGIKVALEVLHEFGEKFPSKPKAVNVIMELVQTQRKVQSKKDEELINLPEVTDPRKLHALKLVSVFGTMTPLVGNELTSLLSTLRVVQLSLRDGVAPISTHAYASFGMAMAMIGHPDEAFRFGNIALEMLKRFDTPPQIQAHTMAVVHGGCRHWKAPIKESLPPLMKAYEEGMAVGDLKFSFLSAYNYLLGSLESGIALSQVEVDIRTFCEGLDDMCQNHNNAFRTLLVPVWQQVLNLMGKSENPLQLIGTAMNEPQFILDSNTTKFVGGVLVLTKAKLLLAYHFDNFHLAEKICDELEKDEKLVVWHFTVYQLKAYCCLTFLHLYEETSKKKYRGKAVKILKQLEGWTEQGNVNCRAIVLLLRAELTSIERGRLSETDNSTAVDPGAIKQQFEVAILEFAMVGLTQMQALGNERAAMACFRAEEFRDGAAYVLQARELYHQWGAHAKVTYLEKKFDMFFQTANAVRAPPADPATLSIGSIAVRRSP